ncbi:MAG: hypothetical protein AAGA18_10430 [Verrucomicrobiota bacterium]
MIKYLLLVLTLLVSCTKKDDLIIQSVTIETIESGLIKELTDPSDFSAFYHFYLDRSFTRETHPNFSYIIDIHWSRGNERGSNKWYYDPRGFYQISTKPVTPLFVLKDDSLKEVSAKTLQSK